MLYRYSITLYVYYNSSAAQSADNGSECTTGDVRVTGLSSSRAGRFEMCADGAWGTVCDAYGNWSLRNSYVACNMLGYNFAVLAEFPAERRAH